MSRHHLSLLIDCSNSHLSDPAPLKGNYSRYAQTQKTSLHNVAHLVNHKISLLHLKNWWLYKETFPIEIFVNFDRTVVFFLFTVNNLLLFTHIDQQSI